MRITAGEEPPGRERAVVATSGADRWVYHWWEIFPAMVLIVHGERCEIWLESDDGDDDRSCLRLALRHALAMFEAEIAEGAEVVVGDVEVVAAEGLDEVSDKVLDELQQMVDRRLI